MRAKKAERKDTRRMPVYLGGGGGVVLLKARKRGEKG